jgi:sulfite oxidase
MSPRRGLDTVLKALQGTRPAAALKSRHRTLPAQCGVPSSQTSTRSIKTASKPSFVNQELAGKDSGRPHVETDSQSSRTRPKLLLAILATSCLAVFSTGTTAFAEEPPSASSERFIRLAEVHEHNSKSDTYWVFRGDRVYDITEWVPNHPGGEVILRAVGSSIDPYWNIFAIHQKQEVYDILEQYFIGKIDPRDLVDGRAPAGAIDDPFKNDPKRRQDLIERSARPCNSETPEKALGSFITPDEQFYVRNHLWVPSISDADTHSLTIEMPDGEEVVYTVADLKKKFQEHTITATMQCSGNRRSHMTQNSRQTNGLQWGVGAMGNAEWTGVRLRDVLADAGLAVTDLPEEVSHVQFVGAEAYGASIPIDKAVAKNGDVLLVYAMNGKPLMRDHGFPLRVLVPGHVAARSVKWLNKIVLADEESTSQWQRRDYKCFGPNVGSKPDWDSAPAIQETPVQSAITSVRQLNADSLNKLPGSLARVYGLEEDSVLVSGYAFAGGGRRIVRVDVSPDDGRTWQQAQILEAEEKGAKAWSWRQWRMAFPSHELSGHICVKAVDESYNTQPEGYAAHYNVRGNLANGWHRVSVARDDEVEK